MKKSENWGSSSYHGVDITTTPNKLIALAEKLGADYCRQNTGRDKTNFDFDFRTDSDEFFTVYDWKEYRPLKLNSYYDFHIGAENRAICEMAKRELQYELSNLNYEHTS